MSNDVRSPALVSSNIDGRSLCVSMSGAFSRSALARSSNVGSGTGASSVAALTPASTELARTAEPAIRLVCSRKRRRDIKRLLPKVLRGPRPLQARVNGAAAALYPVLPSGHHLTTLPLVSDSYHATAVGLYDGPSVEGPEVSLTMPLDDLSPSGRDLM